MRVFLLFVLLAALRSTRAAEPYGGDLQAAAPAPVVVAGSELRVELSFSKNTDASRRQRTIEGRSIVCTVHAMRWSVLDGEPQRVDSRREGASSLTVSLPPLPPGWYILTVAAGEREDERSASGGAAAGSDAGADVDGPLVEELAFVVRDPSGGAVVRVHTERGRTVFSPGERLRLFVSARGLQAVAREVGVWLEPRAAGPALEVGSARLDAPPGREVSVALDWPAEATRLVAAGDYDLVVRERDAILDRLGVVAVDPRRAGASARWWHGDIPFRSDPVTPGWLRRARLSVVGEGRDVHGANFVMSLFSDGAIPQVAKRWALPGAGRADCPPSAAATRPSGTDAVLQLLMAQGIAAGIMQGGNELGPENYNPMPTVDTNQQAIVARKYLSGAMSLAQHPNMVALYADVYGRPDWHGKGGKGELTDEEVETAARLNWEQGWRAAGLAAPPDAPLDAAGRRTYPLPWPGDAAATAGPDATYRFTSFVLEGMQRCLAASTRMVEGELPAVFTLLNKNRENHRQPLVYAWRDWSRSPSVAPEASRGTTGIAVSEWNLDAEPQAYLLSTFIQQPLLDEGRPVYRTAGFTFNGSQSRWLRDAVYLSGKGIVPFYHTAREATWSHRGADQATYAGKDRLRTVSLFLTTYEGLFRELTPVREVALYQRPGWGDESVAAWVTAFPAICMAGYQVEMLSHSELASGAMERYRAVLALGQPEPLRCTFEQKAFASYLAKGGAVFSSVAHWDRYDPALLDRLGVKRADVPRLNADGSPQLDKQGKPRSDTVWTASEAQRAAAVKESMWPGLPAVRVLPVDFGERWGYVDADGRRQSWGRHWTGFQEWGNARAPALAALPAVVQGLGEIGEPLVKKDQPEVFVWAARPRDAAARGLYLFAANFTLPSGPAWTQPRVPWFFWPTYAAPVRARIAVRDPGAAVYDLLQGREVPSVREGERLVFPADLTQAEGAVFAVLPERVAGATLTAPAEAPPGTVLTGRFTLSGASGAPLGVLGSVRVRLRDAGGRVFTDLYRALPASGALPPLTVPATVRGPLELTVTDTVAGFEACASVAVTPAPLPRAATAALVTVSRGDRVCRLLHAPGLRIVVDSGRTEMRDGKVTVAEANPGLPLDLDAAGALARALTGAGIAATVVESREAIDGVLRGTPFTGGGAAYRGGAVVPDRRIDGPVLLVGHPERSALLAQLDLAGVPGRSLGRDNAGPGKAVIAFLPRAFHWEHDAAVVSFLDEAGARAAAARIAELARADEGPDPWFAARERVRAAWLPAEVASFKQASGVLPKEPEPAQSGGRDVVARAGAWRGLRDQLGPHVFALDAAPGGVAVSLTSLATPVMLLGPDGELRTALGGGARVWARDVGVAADGRRAIAGFALAAETVLAGADGKPLWSARSGVVHSVDPLAWDTYKDSERFLALTPDHRTAVVAAGRDGYQAIDLATGARRWQVPVDSDPARPLGPASEQLGMSPDGSVVLLRPSRKTGEKPVLDKQGKPRVGSDGKPQVEWVGEKPARLVNVVDGSTVWEAPGDAGGWELYAAVGPRGAWTITGQRGSAFSIRDDRGQVVRSLTSAMLPEPLGRDIGLQAPLFLAGQPGDRVVVARPETSVLYVYRIAFGSPEQRRAAAAAARGIEDAVAAVREEIAAGVKRRGWDAPTLDAFWARIDAPDAARQLVRARMQRLESEQRAGRPRDARWFDDDVRLFGEMLALDRRPVLDAALDFAPVRSIALPALLHDAVVSPGLDTVFVGLWDGSVRAYDVSSGVERWQVVPGGGAHTLALVAGADPALYAGSTRGLLHRLDPSTGALRWSRVLTDLPLAGRDSRASAQ